ncbi:BspA family leucine-rich repeat surface protein [Butyrivibrio sp. INlla16]|uniref:BspA family leucine-rich repeat surface protein n=1 Tax=Butyrivibrio sp. INlla16 TaxID=1520807 RepID=UPI00087F9118|nr:BspA family leucine-rich repeat surface protein [Butyrivibrio sp. INlla16]SDB21927.1 surface protein [Butyrivibrio sp. INlla16]
MKKYKNAFLIVAGFILIICMSSLKSEARTYSNEVGTINNFSNVKNRLAGSISYFAPGNYQYLTGMNNTVKKMKFITNADVSPYNGMPSTSVGNGVTAYYDSKNGIVYICTTASKLIFDSAQAVFSEYRALEEIDFSGANVCFYKDVDSTKNMFYNCRNLKFVDLSTCDTSNVTDMTSMFEGCEKLKSVKLGNFKTSKVTSFRRMFYGCERLENLTLRSFDTSNASDMRGMFGKCRNLKELDVSTFDTSAVMYMGYMFGQCNGLTALNLSSFDTKAVLNMGSMFEGCENLGSLDLSSFDVSSATYLNAMFYGCRSLKYLNLSSFELSQNTITGAGFLKGCKAITILDAPKKVAKEIDLPIEYYIDNNKDGNPDTKTKYSKMAVTNKSNRYIFWVEKPVVAPKKTPTITKVHSFGIDYDIHPDGRVVVTKISVLENVAIDTVKAKGVRYPVTEIADGACKGNKNIQTIEIGSSVKSIGNSAFYGCKNLKKVTINANNHLHVGSNAFKKMSRKTVIQVKGIKGKAKKQLVKTIKKNTNAKVR